MPTFLEYFEKNKKVYEFKVSIAGEHGTDVKDRLKTILNKFTVENISSGKKTPIQESPLEFPQLKNTEVTHYDVTLRYPTTASVLEEMITRECNVGPGHVKVRSGNDPLNDLEAEPKTEGKYTPLIGNDDLGGDCGQSLAGQNRVMDLLKELETARKERASSTGQN